MKYITLFLLVFSLLFSVTGDVYGGFLSSLADQLDALNNNMGQVGANIGANYEEGGISGAFNGAMGDLGSANESNEQYRKATIQEFKDDLKKIASYIPGIIKKAWGNFVDFLGKIRDLFLCENGNSQTPPADSPPAAEEATEVPTDEPTAEETTEVPTDEPTAEETTEVPADEPAAEEATEVPADEPAEEATEVPADEPAQEATEVPADEPAEETTEVPADEPAADTPSNSGTLKKFIKAFEAEPNFNKKLTHYIDQTVATEGMAGTISTSEISDEARVELSEKLMNVSEENTKMEESLSNHISSSLNKGSHNELDSLIEATTKMSSSARKATAPLTENITRILREKMMSLEDKELLLNKLNMIEKLQ